MKGLGIAALAASATILAALGLAARARKRKTEPDETREGRPVLPRGVDIVVEEPTTITTDPSIVERIVERGGDVVETVTEFFQPTVDWVMDLTDLTESHVKSIQRNADTAWTQIPPTLLADLSEVTGLAPATLAAIATIEAGPYQENAFRFECHLFNEDSSTKVPCTLTDRPYSTVRDETNYDAFLVAYRINASLACEVSSWGAFQVLNPVGKGMASTAQKWVERWESENRWKLSIELAKAWFAKSYNQSSIPFAQAAEAAGGTPESWVDFVLKYNGSWATQPGHDYHKAISAAYQFTNALAASA